MSGTPLPEGHPFRAIKAHPLGPTRPELWILGSSDYGAQLAAHFGLPYAFAYFFSDGRGVEEALDLYRRNYRPSERHPKPQATICVWALAADTEAEARRLLMTREYWRAGFERGVRDPLIAPEEAAAYPYSPSERSTIEALRRKAFVGTAEQVSGAPRGARAAPGARRTRRRHLDVRPGTPASLLRTARPGLRARLRHRTRAAPMLNILAITVPIYIVIAIGFVAGRSGLFSGPDMRVLGKFVVNFALPALLFTALSQRAIAEILNFRYLAAYGLASLTILLGATAVARFVQRKSVAQSALIGVGMAFSNSGYIGFPIAFQVLGPPAAVALAMSMIVENVFLMPLAMTLAEMGGKEGHGWQRVLLQSLVGLTRNPIILGIAAGFVVSLLGIRLSEPLTRTINMLALASTALALFVIGGSLVGLEVRNVFADAVTVALGKLVLHPLAVFAMLWLLGPVDVHLRMAAVIFASVPMLSIYPILAHKYQLEGFCAAALLVATLLSFLTVSAALWLMTSVLGWTA